MLEFGCKLTLVFFVAGLAFIVLSIAVAGASVQAFLSRLEKNHPAEWVALGKPMASDDPLEISGVESATYFSERRYESLQDQTTIFLGNLARLSEGVAFRLAIGLFLLFLGYYFGVKPYMGLTC